MAVVYDKLLDEELSHKHPSSDLSDYTVLDDRYVNAAGDSMTGDLIFSTAAIGIVLKDANGVQWRVTVDTTGALVTSQTQVGMSMGLLLALTYTD